MSSYIKVLKNSFEGFMEDDCLSSSAAIAYYTIFSLPPLVVIALSITNALGFSQKEVDRILYQELGMPMTQISAQGSELTSSTSANNSADFQFNLQDLGTFSTLLGIGILLFSASAIFGELQYSLNKVWRVAPDPTRGYLSDFLFKRLLSAGMLIVIWFVLLISLALTAVIRQVLQLIWGETPGILGQWIGLTINETTTLALATVFFAAIFKILPDARMRWRDVWVGAAATALLFVIGKILIGWYLRSCQVGLSWGTSAASVAAALVWVYYSSLIVLYGAELTEAWSTSFGTGAEPVEGAVRVKSVKPTLVETRPPNKLT